MFSELSLRVDFYNNGVLLSRMMGFTHNYYAEKYHSSQQVKCYDSIPRLNYAFLTIGSDISVNAGSVVPKCHAALHIWLPFFSCELETRLEAKVKLKVAV